MLLMETKACPERMGFDICADGVTVGPLRHRNAYVGD
jgi:hypothetical protein